MINLVAFFSTIVFILLFRKHAERLGLVDVPGGRKNHEGAVPVIGGIAILVSFIFSSFACGQPLDSFHSFFVNLLLLTVVGTLDDLHDLSARTRFFAQIVAALLMTSWGGVFIDDLGNLFGNGTVHLHNWAIPFTVFCVLGVINAFNMIDGVDGLAGGLVFIALVLFGSTALLAGLTIHATLIFLLASAVLGFLVFNMRSPWRSKAAVFMGDAGSMMLGYALARFAVDLTDSDSRALTPITAVWILAIPLMDTVNTMVRRMLKGRSPFSADREHLHHIFLRAGYSVSRTVVMILSVSLLLGLIGLAGWHYGVPEYMMFYAFLLLFALYSFAMSHAWKVMKAIKNV
jgi:UDP-GlcNAc:undecaprenyl-phosphate/decaprenyl-phosphate GlcNAc-1-phosphate transferase